MTDFSSKILNTAVSSLSAQQAVIATTSNNVANANTPGYARRVLTLENRTLSTNPSAVSVGDGVDIADVKRFVDEFLEKNVRNSLGQQEAYKVEDSYLDRIQSLFSLGSSGSSVGQTLQGFFTALNDLSVNPASVELRLNVIARAEDLVTSISSTYNSLASMQTELDQRLALELDNVNNLTAQIADMNSKVATREGAGNLAADERDKRDLLLTQLAEKLEFSTVESADGQLSVFLSNGLTLVSGSTSHDLEVTKTPSFNSGGLPPSLDGGILNFVVYDYGNDAHVDLTGVLGGENGTLGGMLRIRGIQDHADTSSFEADGTLVEVASRIEALARTLLTEFNEVYLGPDEDSGTAGHQASSGDLDGNTPGVYGFFSATGVSDADADGLPNDLGALSIDNYASILRLTSSDERDIAAARDVNSTAGATAFVPGDSSNLAALVATQNVSYAFSAGNFSATGTYEEIINQTVAFVGNEKSKSAANLSVSEDNYSAAANRRDQLSAVSLDEEFTNLIRYQKAFEAAARMVRTAQDLLDQIISLIS